MATHLSKAILLHEAVIRGHHVYMSLWTPEMGETLKAVQESDNVVDKFAVAVLIGDIIVGHVPRTLSKIFWKFIQLGGEIHCEVSGRRRHGKGLEVSCVYRLLGRKT